MSTKGNRMISPALVVILTTLTLNVSVSDAGFMLEARMGGGTAGNTVLSQKHAPVSRGPEAGVASQG